MNIGMANGKQSRKDSHRCTCGKVRYRDKKEAVAALHRIHNKVLYAKWEHRGTHRHETRSYLCGACHGWHLTSKVLGEVSEPWKWAA